MRLGGGLAKRWGMNMKPVRGLLAGGIAFSILRAMLQWAAPWPLKLVFDSVLNNLPLPPGLGWVPANRIQRLDIFSVAMVVIALLLGVCAYGANALLATAGQKVVYDLRCRLFRHVESQTIGFHRRHQVGDLLSRLGGDVQSMQTAVVNVMPVLFENILTVGGMLTIMFLLDWRYSLLALSLVPVLFLTVRYHMTAIRQAQRQARRNEGLATAAAQQVLVALPVVQAFGTEEEEADRYASLAMQGLEANRKAIVLQSRFTPIVTVTMTASTALVIFFGARAILRGHLTAGDLLVFMAYLRSIFAPVRQLAKLAGTMGRGQASAERVGEILATKEHVPERPDARPLHRTKGHIRFEGVSFGYGSDSRVLHEVDLDIEGGSLHALVGSTGSGKSTLLRFVPRFIDPDEGRVTLDDIDLRDIDLAALRDKVALVPQEPFLLRATVWENIAYGTGRRTKAGAVAAARAAGVHEVLLGLRDGYDTVIGERGTALSGGQRQCVAVARAMARNAPVLLLDEPTTGLDASTEAVLVDALQRISEGRTTIFVTHQLRAIRDADRITVLSHGKIVEQGSHDQLLGAGSAYWHLQQSASAISAEGVSARGGQLGAGLQAELGSGRPAGTDLLSLNPTSNRRNAC